MQVLLWLPEKRSAAVAAVHDLTLHMQVSKRSSWSEF